MLLFSQCVALNEWIFLLWPPLFLGYALVVDTAYTIPLVGWLYVDLALCTPLRKTKCLLSHPTGQDNCRQPVILIVAEHPIKSTFPFAAYLVPKDISHGSKVYVPDIIENFIESRWNQGDVYRLNDGFGIFTGDDIVFDYPTDPDEVGEIMG